MSFPVLIAGFTLGLAGSLHCVGMCGPLSLALPVQHFSGSKKFTALLLYQFGRVITYSIIGLLFGLAGRTIYLTGHQQTFSIIMGSGILLMCILYFIEGKRKRLNLFPGFYAKLQKTIAVILRSATGPFSFLVLGMANGLLPCGMVYMALASTLSFSEVTQSILFMAMFGLGTLPAMMLVGYAGLLIKPNLRIHLRKLVPVFICAVGVMLILRGMNLGIPLVSPQFSVVRGIAIGCHP